MGQDVGVRAHEHADAALVGAHAADRRRPLPGPLQPERLSSSRRTRGQGRNGTSLSLTATGPAPGPPPPCGVENVLCVLKCMTSKPAGAGLELAQDRVHVRAVHVGQRAGAVDRVEHLLDAASRTGPASRGWSASRPPCAGRARPRSASRSIVALRVGRNRDGLEAGHRGRRGVGAVRRVGHDHLVPLRYRRATAW